MKTIYFVRHGESENNATNQYNAIDTSLSERGKKQAEEVAKRCAKLPIEIIIASSMTRAQQTAHVISSRTGISVETADYFRERTTSTSILGKSKDDPEVTEIVKQSSEHFHDPGWRAEGGENFEDLKRRALRGLDYLAKRNEKTIAVVSHGFFMYIISAATIFGSGLTSQECLHIIDGLEELENTALSVVKFVDTKKTRSRSHWRLAVWNDHAHLG